MTKRTKITLSDSWEYYPVTLNEELATIRVDLLAKETLATAIHTHYIRIGYDTNDLGMPEEEELNRLNAIEDKIEAYLLQKEDIYHIGTILSQGLMDLFYVSENEIDWDAITKEMMTSTHYVSGSFMDDNYALYDTSLFPSIYDFNAIQNRNLCMQLEANGINPQIAIPIDFYFQFPTKEDGIAFTQALNPKFEIVNFELSDANEHILQINLALPPSFANLNALTSELLRSALSFNGSFDSWGI